MGRPPPLQARPGRHPRCLPRPPRCSSWGGPPPGPPWRARGPEARRMTARRYSPPDPAAKQPPNHPTNQPGDNCCRFHPSDTQQRYMRMAVRAHSASRPAHCTAPLPAPCVCSLLSSPDQSLHTIAHLVWCLVSPLRPPPIHPGASLGGAAVHSPGTCKVRTTTACQPLPPLACTSSSTKR